MKRKIPLFLAASLVAAAGLSGMSYAKGGNGNGGGHGAGGAGHSSGHSASAHTHSASNSAPGRVKASGKNATAYAPGRIKQADSAAAYAPGTLKKATTDEDNVDGAAKVNFGMLISSIRASKTNLDGIDDATAVSVVDVDDLTRGNNRVALENALADRQSQIADLRADLTALNLSGLQTEDVEQAVGVATAKDGSLTVFVDRDQ